LIPVEYGGKEREREREREREFMCVGAEVVMGPLEKGETSIPSLE